MEKDEKCLLNIKTDNIEVVCSKISTTEKCKTDFSLSLVLD